MPSFYQFNGAMLTPETIESRRATAKTGVATFATKASLAAAVLEAKAQAGEKVSSAQAHRISTMRTDQLQELLSMHLKTVKGKKKEEPVKTVTNQPKK